MNKLIITIVLNLTLLSAGTFSQVTQEWIRTFNGPGNSSDFVNSITTDNSGNIYETGSTKVNTQYDIITIKYSTTGVLLWTAGYNGVSNFDDGGFDIKVDNSGNVYVTGTSMTDNVSKAQMVTIKYDNNGNEIWHVLYGSSTGYSKGTSLSIDNLGNIYVAGTAYSDSLHSGPITIKYNTGGNVVWANFLNNNGSQNFQGTWVKAILDNSGNVYVTGTKNLAINNNNTDIYTAKYDNNGVTKWISSYSSSFHKRNYSTSIALDNGGNVYVTGGSVGASTLNFEDLITIKYDNSGNQLWEQRLTPSQGNYQYWGNEVAVDHLNSVYVTGKFGNNTIPSGMGLVKYNSFGTQQWLKIYARNGYTGVGSGSIGTSLKIDNLNYLYITGTQIHVDSNTYQATLKYSPNGNQLWNILYQGAKFLTEFAASSGNELSLDNTGKVFVGNNNFAVDSLSDIVAVKYAQTHCSVTGLVTFNDNSQPVTSGFVKAFYYDNSTANIVTVDSTAIQPDGHYTFINIPAQDSLDIMCYQNDDELNFVPTYYASTIDWRLATKIYTTGNLSNINVQVFRINNTTNPFNISGQAFQNTSLGTTVPLKDVIIYALIGNEYKNYGITIDDGTYISDKLPPGSYTMAAYRIGFAPVTQNVTITNNNVPNINFSFGNPIGIQPLSNEIPKNFRLYQNYPNPFNPETNIKFDIPKTQNVKIVVYDIMGREVNMLIDEELKAGSYNIKWNGSNCASGVYFYRIETSSFVNTKKMLLVK